MGGKLKEYYSKRDFKRSPEPKGGEHRKDGAFKYVVQEHHATHLHYDLRLEMEGTLRSWAVPKGVPTEMNVRRLAVQTEDHPVEYANFEGVIPEGEYGAGTVKVWDRGVYSPVKMSENKLIVDVEGTKIRGRYCLIRFKPKENLKNWLLFKVKRE